MDMMEEWNKDYDKQVWEELLREPKALPGQPLVMILVRFNNTIIL